MYNFEANKNYVSFDEYGREFVFTVKEIINENIILVVNQDTKDTMYCDTYELNQSREIKAYSGVEFKFLFALRFFLKDELQQEYDLNDMENLFVDLSNIGLYESIHYVDNVEFNFQYRCSLVTLSCEMLLENTLYSIQKFNSVESLSEYIENLSLEKIFDLLDDEKIQDLVECGIIQGR